MNQRAAHVPVPSRSGLKRLREALRRLGDPQAAFPAIHVTGSHGKSSVVAFLEGIFDAAGYRVGTFCPSSPRELGGSLRLEGRPVAGTELGRALETVERTSPVPLGPSERLAAAAYLLLAEAGVDIAVVGAEVGGRDDVTNCLPRRLLTLVTGVEVDRVDLFGQGISRPSWEEAGTAAMGTPFLTVERRVEALAAFAEGTKRSGAALVLLDPADLEPVEVSWEGATWRSREDPLGLGEFAVPSPAIYQRANLCLALGAVAELVGGWDLGPGHIRTGLLRAALPGRFEVVSRAPYVVLDGARNPAAARGLVETLERLHRGGRRTLIFATERGRPVRGTAEALFPFFDRVVLYDGGDPTLPPEALAPQARRLGVPWEAAASIGEALREAVPAARDEDLVVVVGPKPSLAEAHRELGIPS